MRRVSTALTGRVRPKHTGYAQKCQHRHGVYRGGGYSSASGFTGGRESEAKVKELVIRKARTVVAMVDSSKLSRILPFTFARLADFHIVVDDGRLPDDFLEEARKLNITVI